MGFRRENFFQFFFGGGQKKFLNPPPKKRKNLQLSRHSMGFRISHVQIANTNVQIAHHVQIADTNGTDSPSHMCVIGTNSRYQMCVQIKTILTQRRGFQNSSRGGQNSSGARILMGS